MPLSLLLVKAASGAAAAYALSRLGALRDGPAPDHEAEEAWRPADVIDGRLRPEIGPQRPRAPRAGEAEARLRLVTFNVQGARDVPRLADAIRESRALCPTSVFLLQEIDDVPAEGESRARALAGLLDLNFAYVPARTIGDRTHGLAILARHRLEDVRVMELKRLQTRFRLHRRVAMAATVDVGGTPLRLFNVHLDTCVNPWRRRQQIEAVAETAGAHTGPCVLGGDVNTNPALWLARWMPIFYADQPRALDRFMGTKGFDAPTAASGPTHWLRTRLDSFYTRDLPAADFGVDRRVRVSDHFPVWIDLTV